MTTPNLNSHVTLDEILSRAKAAYARGLLDAEQLREIESGVSNLRCCAHLFSCKSLAEALLCWIPDPAKTFIMTVESTAVSANS